MYSFSSWYCNSGLVCKLQSYDAIRTTRVSVGNPIHICQWKTITLFCIYSYQGLAVSTVEQYSLKFFWVIFSTHKRLIICAEFLWLNICKVVGYTCNFSEWIWGGFTVRSVASIHNFIICKGCKVIVPSCFRRIGACLVESAGSCLFSVTRASQLLSNTATYQRKVSKSWPLGWIQCHDQRLLRITDITISIYTTIHLPTMNFKWNMRSVLFCLYIFWLWDDALRGCHHACSTYSTLLLIVGNSIVDSELFHRLVRIFIPVSLS